MSSWGGAWLPAGVNPQVINRRLRCLHKGFGGLVCLGVFEDFCALQRPNLPSLMQFGKQTTKLNACFLTSFILLYYILEVVSKAEFSQQKVSKFMSPTFWSVPCLLCLSEVLNRDFLHLCYWLWVFVVGFVYFSFFFSWMLETDDPLWKTGFLFA